ncbi:MAG: HAD family hydrolase [Planctomycetes bacterium]|nr:HAD family hydrolase [Planctomycetota bacterium]HRV80289.1 HAD family hydrolase [Planctomycetota bacterium]
MDSSKHPSGSPCLRIAMWSGPRNVSTALMRSFGSRADTVVCDEPLYAHYLQQTGLPHPMADEVLRVHETDWRQVAAWLTGPVAGQPRIFYQKHMAHHLLDSIGRDWLGSLTHAFLVRSPRAMLRSLLAVLPNPRLEDTGLPQQVALFEAVLAQQGTPPPVVDSASLLKNPEAVLRRLCDRLGVAFDPAMLAWSPGPRATDGCWAPAWYSNVERSTGFLPYREESAELPVRWEPLAQACEALYAQLVPYALHA